MTRVAAALRWEAVLQARHQFYGLSAVVAVVWISLLYLLPAGARARPDVLVPAFLVTNLQVTAFYFATALVLLEKGQGIVHALAVSPLRPAEYLGAKAVSLAALATAENTLIVVVVFGMRFQWLWLVTGTLCLSLIYALLGIVAVARYETINTFLMPSVGILTILLLPLAAYYDLVPWWVFAWHPVAPPLALIEAGIGTIGTARLMYGMLGGALSLSLAFAWAGRRHRQYIAA